MGHHPKTITDSDIIQYCSLFDQWGINISSIRLPALVSGSIFLKYGKCPGTIYSRPGQDNRDQMVTMASSSREPAGMYAPSQTTQRLSFTSRPITALPTHPQSASSKPAVRTA